MAKHVDGQRAIDEPWGEAFNRGVDDLDWGAAFAGLRSMATDYSGKGGFLVILHNSIF